MIRGTKSGIYPNSNHSFEIFFIFAPTHICFWIYVEYSNYHKLNY
ncbi:hypothetical protein ACJIZ3_012332 [Penstemon smallii]|uniref:Uncharacterized protein n=1 Tax=Penstemon smallii TaxID=265156 RepID=A0ABD3UQ93_9LAMI